MDRLHSAIATILGRSSAPGTDSEGVSDEPVLTDVRHVGEARAEMLREADFRTVADVRKATPAELREVGDIGATRAEQIRDSAAQVANNADARDGEFSEGESEDE